jgi:hypothetical protein
MARVAHKRACIRGETPEGGKAPGRQRGSSGWPKRETDLETGKPAALPRGTREGGRGRRGHAHRRRLTQGGRRANHHPARGDPRYRQPRQQAYQILRIHPLAGPSKQTVPPPGQTPGRLGPARAGLLDANGHQRTIPLLDEAAEPSPHGGGEGLPRLGLGSPQPKGQGRQEGQRHQSDRHLLQRLQTL